MADVSGASCEDAASSGADVVIGLGFTGSARAVEVRAAVDDTLARCGRTWDAVYRLATTARRIDHPALAGLAAQLDYHEPSALAKVATPNPSGRVARVAGTPSVAEAAALLSSGASRLWFPKRCTATVCTAVALFDPAQVAARDGTGGEPCGGLA